jgi:hypothetical protein
MSNFLDGLAQTIMSADERPYQCNWSGILTLHLHCKVGIIEVLAQWNIPRQQPEVGKYCAGLKNEPTTVTILPKPKRKKIRETM